MNDDWLDTGTSLVVDAGVPGLSSQAIDLAADSLARRGQFITAWQSLTEQQRVFLNMWRENRFNMRATLKVLRGTQFSSSKTTVYRWSEDPAYELARTMLRAGSIEEILSRDNLVARQDDIVETLLTPKPILYQGEHTGFEEVDASAAARANETLLKVGGHLKDKDIDLNVGITGPEFVIQVVQPEGNIIDITPRGVPVELPETPADGDWPDGA